jgi:hypothetical protein
MPDMSISELQQKRAVPPILIDAHRAAVRSRAGSWRCHTEGEDGEAWFARVKGQPLNVIWSISFEEDGNLWVHVSCSHQSRVPTWEEMCAIKSVFLGDEVWACQLHPPASQHINIHERVLHLFAPFTNRHWPLPDFTSRTGSI